MTSLLGASRKDLQYSLGKIMALWTLSALPMGVLAFMITPAISARTQYPALLVYWMAVNLGLIWQFVLSLIVLKAEGHALKWQTIATRMKYQKPVNPRTGKSGYNILWWTLPFIGLSAIIQSGVMPLPDIDGMLAPLIQDLPKYELSSLSPAAYKGAWWILGMFLLTSLFNYFLGEEFFYRGILLPKMNGAFGKWDWFANGILFGFYHLHKPQVILSTALYFGFVFAFPSRYFQSGWMAVIIHGLEGIMGIVFILGIILG